MWVQQKKWFAMGRKVLCPVGSGLGVLAAVAGGFAVGASRSALDCLAYVSPASLAAVILATYFLLRPRALSSNARLERFAAGGLLIYVVLAVLTGRFAWVGGSQQDQLVAAGWLVPLVVGGALLPSRGCWLAGLAYAALLFAASGALVYSASHDSSGVGLFHAWLS